MRAGQRQAVVVHADADDLPGDHVAGVHPGDDFLAEIASLGETDGTGELASLGGEHRFVEIDPEERPTGLDACGIEGGPADRAERRLPMPVA